MFVNFYTKAKSDFHPSGLEKLVSVSSWNLPLAQWLEHPTRSRRVMGSDPIWVRFLLAFNINKRVLLILTDVETTGSSNEFYDKFSIRYHISIIMKTLWDDLSHRRSIITESRYY